MDPTLSDRALGRATLARQLLLERAPLGVAEAVGRVLAVQSQWPRAPFLGLWSRIAGFDRAALVRAFQDRGLVRATTMRATLHTMRAADFLRLRRAMQPGLDRALQQVLRARGTELDLPRLLARGRACFGRGPRTFEAVRDDLAAGDDALDERAMGHAVRLSLPLVMVPTSDAWGFPQVSEFADAEAWLGRPVDDGEHTGELVLRYLAAYGPASAVDIQAWTGLPALAKVIAGLGERVRTFRDARGKAIYDVPDAPRPDPDVPAPVRLVPEFDGAIVARADPRILPAAHRKHVFASGLRVLPTVLVDGVAVATWKLERTKRKAMIVVDAFAPLGKREQAAVAAEAEALVRFAEPDAAEHDVRVTAPAPARARRG